MIKLYFKSGVSSKSWRKILYMVSSKSTSKEQSLEVAPVTNCKYKLHALYSNRGVLPLEITQDCFDQANKPRGPLSYMIEF